jgi:hypothetical protein
VGTRPKAEFQPYASRSKTDATRLIQGHFRAFACAFDFEITFALGR